MWKGFLIFLIFLSILPGQVAINPLAELLDVINPFKKDKNKKEQDSKKKDE